MEKFMETGLPIPFGWFAVGYSKDLATGDVEPLYLFDQHLVLFRTEAGEAKLLEAFCPHLGAHLGHGGKVVGDHIACPFHAWEINGDGEVKNIPYANNLPKRAKDGACMRSFPIQERNQMIWAWYHPRAIEPTFDIEDIPEFSDPEWTDPITWEWEFNSHIQETGENAVDIAHFVYVHNAQTMPKANVELDGHKRSTDMITLGPVIDDEGNMDMSKTEEMHLLSRNIGPGMSCQVFSRAFQTVLMGTITPINAGRVKLRFAFTKPKNISEIFNVYTDGLIQEIVNQVQHDMPIWENKIYREDPILCDGDGPIAKYRRWFAQFYDDGAEESPVRLVK